ILDRYVLISFIKNYLISLMVLLGLYVVLDMVFNFDELAEVQQKAQIIGNVREVSQAEGQYRATLGLTRNDTAAVGTEFRIAGPSGSTIAVLTVDDSQGNQASGPLVLSGTDLPRKAMIATAPGPAASSWAVFASIVSY